LKLSFISPALLLILIFVVVPTIWMIYFSFKSDNGGYGIINYVNVIKDKSFLNPSNFPKFPMGALIQSLIWIAIHLPTTIVLGLFFAVLMHNVKGIKIPRAMIISGMVIPMAVCGIMFRYLFEKDAGMIPKFFNIIGVDSLAHSWTIHSNTAIFALIIGSIWIWTGFTLLVYSAGLTAIPQQIYDAAEIDGASTFRRFFYITVPLLKPITTFIVVMTLIWNFKTFDIVYTATSGGPGGVTEVLGLYIFNTAFRFFAMHKSAAAATILLIISFILSLLLVIRRNK